MNTSVDLTWAQEQHASNLSHIRFLTALLDQGWCWSRQTTVRTELGIDAVLKDDWEVLSAYRRGGGQHFTYENALAYTGSALVLVTKTEYDQEFTIQVAAQENATAEATLDDIRSQLPPIVRRDDGTISISFWVSGPHGAVVRPRRIRAIRWADIAGNYNADAVEKIEEVTHLLPPVEGGRLLLWHGEPGTGKTTALRALAQEWQPWCFTADTHILMADWTEKRAADVVLGDEVMSYKGGAYVTSRVLSATSRTSRTVRVDVGEAQLRCTPDHVFHVQYASPSKRKLAARDLEGKSIRRTKLRGWSDRPRTTEYDRGYLQGALAGDGSYSGSDRKVRWEVTDRCFAERLRDLVNSRGHQCRAVGHAGRTERHKRTYRVVSTLTGLEDVLDLPRTLEEERGFIAGFFDSEGTVPASGRQLAIDQKDTKVLDRVDKMLRDFGFAPARLDRSNISRLVINGVAQVDRFMEIFRPVIERKSLRHRQPPKTLSPVKVNAVTPSFDAEVFNITTTVGNYFAEGYLVDNCDTHYIVDPEQFFGSADYMLGVLLENSDGRYEGTGALVLQGAERWRLLIVEDADEFLRHDAKLRSGQSLSRLLNITDGLIGQGLNVLVLITTNEALGDIHPAVSREGRCVANIEFPRLSRGEALEWLKGNEVGLEPTIDGCTVAHLFDLRRQHRQIALKRTPASAGQYL